MSDFISQFWGYWVAGIVFLSLGSVNNMLAERFQHLVGSSPMQHLAQWRMLLATHLLCRSNAPLSRIAEEVGYQTDTAFSRALISSSFAAGSSAAAISDLYAASSPPAMGSDPQSPLGQAKRYWNRSPFDIALPAMP